MKVFSKKRTKTIVIALIIAVLCSNGLIALALKEFTISPVVVSTRNVPDDVYDSSPILSYIMEFKDTWISTQYYGTF